MIHETLQKFEPKKGAENDNEWRSRSFGRTRARYLKQFVPAFATVATLFNVRAANTPAKFFGAFAVNSFLHPEVRLAANNDAVFHSSIVHSCVSKTRTEMRVSKSVAATTRPYSTQKRGAEGQEA